MKLPSGKHAYKTFILCIVVLFAIFTHAQEPETETSSTSSTTVVTAPDTRASSSPQNDASSAETPTNIRKEHRVQLLQRFQDRIFNLSRNVSNRLTASVHRLQNIADRLDSRIVKEKNAGTDTTRAEAKLSEARQTLMEAESKQSELPSVQQVLTSDTPRESFTVVRANFLATRDLLKKAHAQLTETVLLLKNAPPQQAVPEENDVSTTSESTE